MSWSYAPLWKLLIDKKLKKTDLLTIASIYPQTLANMGKDKPVSMEVLGRLCKGLGCELGDIVIYVPDEDETASE